MAATIEQKRVGVVTGGEELTAQLVVHPPCTFNLEVRLLPEVEGGFSAFVPRLRGALSQGETEAQALRHIAEATKLVLEHYLEQGKKIPWRNPLKVRARELRRWIVVPCRSFHPSTRAR